MKQVSVIWAVAYEVREALADWLQQHEQKIWYAKLSKKDLLRLVRIKVWTVRHRVTYDELFSLILPHIRRTLLGTYNEQEAKRVILGCSMATLCGNTAERILAEALRQKYPEREWIEVWRNNEKDRMLELERREEMGNMLPRFRTWKTSDTAQSFVAGYRKSILAQRRQLTVALSDPKRRLPYRGNPYL